MVVTGFAHKNALRMCCILMAGLLLSAGTLFAFHRRQHTVSGRVLKWVEFHVTAVAMEHALMYDIENHGGTPPLNWVELLSCLGARYGGDFTRYRAADMDNIVTRLRNGETMAQITAQMDFYDYYHTAYSAVLGALVGEYRIQTPQSLARGTWEYETHYGLKAYSPIAWGYNFSHYDDFGDSRSFGFAREHLGNDLLGQIGTPIVAVESGIVEAMGWNQYGGWRIGIRSLDRKRYYYYAHLRSGHPYRAGLREGDTVAAGDVIGYLGMTGYSRKQDVNGMQTPHLHFGLQLIFDESQKDSNHEIWVDVYELVKFLEHHKSPVVRDDISKEYARKYQFIDPALAD